MAGPTASTSASCVFGLRPVTLIGTPQSSLEISRFFCSLIDLLIGSSGSTGVAVSSEFNGKASSLPGLTGGVAAAASDEDFHRPTVFFSFSIDSLIGSFCGCFIPIFFLLTSSPPEDDDVESSDSKLDGGTFFFSSWERPPYSILVPTIGLMNPSRKDPSDSSTFASSIGIGLCQSTVYKSSQRRSCQRHP